MAVAPNLTNRLAATPCLTASLSTTTPREKRQDSIQAVRIQFVSIEQNKKYNQLKAAGMSTNQINQYFSKWKQQERDAANWSEEEKNQALGLKAEGMSNDRIHKTIKLLREDAQAPGGQAGESKVKAAMLKWVEEDKRLELEKYKWSPEDWKRARHLKGAGLSNAEIGLCIMGMVAAAQILPAAWNVHHQECVTPVIYSESTGQDGASTVGSGVDVGGGAGDGAGGGFDFDFDIF